MRKNIIAGNWKMNKSISDGVRLSLQISEYLQSKAKSSPEVIICPPYTHIYSVVGCLKGSKIKTGSQNCSSEEAGAYTGEISASMIASAGAEYTIIGHSERRALFNESSIILKKKVEMALKAGLKVIFCCGEVLSDREGGSYFDIVKSQLEDGLFSLSASEFAGIVIAYEPVWAIGTGKTATTEQAQEMHAYIRKILSIKYGQDLAEGTTILYGGSCNPGNARELFSMKDVDGGLIGGASLKADDFCSIINSF